MCKSREAHNTMASNLTYTTVGTDATITGTTNTSSFALVIPAKIGPGDIYDVVAISNNAFNGNNDVTSIVINDSVLTSGNYAFRNCDNAVSISLSAGMDVIPTGFMSGSAGLTSLTIPSNVTSIGGSAFLGCNSLAGTITFPSGITSIGVSAFQSCAITAFTFQPPFTQTLSIQQSAFVACSALETVYIYGDSGVAYSFGNTAFSGCTALTSILFEHPKEIASVGAGVFPSTEYTNDLTVTYNNTTGTDIGVLQEGMQTDYFDNATVVDYVYDVSCFAEGTLIRCFNAEKGTDEDVLVEDIGIGHLLKTYPSGYYPVARSGSCRLANNPNTPNPLSCMYSMKKEGQMTGDLILTGGHSLLVDDLTEDESTRQTKEFGFAQHVEGKKLLLAACSSKFSKVMERKPFKIYHFAVGEDRERRGIYANGSILCELPSVDSFDTLSSFKPKTST